MVVGALPTIRSRKAIDRTEMPIAMPIKNKVWLIIAPTNFSGKLTNKPRLPIVSIEAETIPTGIPPNKTAKSNRQPFPRVNFQHSAKEML